ncbi:hypothetical protein Metev_0150 [Methanohalobium evestigatum Z-7303]|uniref:Uncharacterized protein n=1 Tax=Methanohalobium evestigatum (strain ATCC BAA-1072 / DSM 3721 / NBRC 107634 / OCM 161 / Z-7303) TaxID=644295 RepID=D7E659_METEZ|nr:hypothetical protein [Methanohalobium evestigatum]ADI73081.1 hypothetical protein Metev_0150 [Methanohalobium evestigatum Z-7303]
MPKCQLCNGTISNGKYHDICDLTIFQLDEIKSLYRNGGAPDWLSEALGELSWIYENNTRTSPYFNVASEIAEMFIIGGYDKLNRVEIKELDLTVSAEREILELLKKGEILDYDDVNIYSGEMINKSKNIVNKGEKLSDQDSEVSRKEMYGFLAVCLTSSLIESSTYGLPKKALAIFYLLSGQMIYSNQGDLKVSNEAFKYAFKVLTPTQRNRITRILAGFHPSGSSRIIDNIDINGNVYLKPKMINYIDRMRELYRSRSRDSRDREY